jgi:hypothetical protein
VQVASQPPPSKERALPIRTARATHVVGRCHKRVHGGQRVFAPEYPPQFADVTYGFDTSVSETVLLDDPATFHAIVPDANFDTTHGNQWTGGNEPFDDSANAGWTVGDQALGFAPDTGNNATYPSQVLADSPLLYYRFEEADTNGPAVDSSPNGNNGTFAGTLGLGATSATGQLGNAADFLNGAPDSAIRVPALGTHAQVTVETWVKMDSRTTFDTIYNVDGWSAGWLHYQFLNNGNLRLSVNGGGPNDRDFQPAGGFQTNTWYHVVATYDATSNSNNAEMFVDGQSIGTHTFANLQPIVFNQGHIGAWNSNSREFDGLLDEFAIYNSVLSPQRIQDHYDASIAPLQHLYTDEIQTDIEADMLNTNGSAYARFPFDNTAAHAIETLTLDVKYDDGFVAYVNGVEVASRNAPGRDGNPGTLAWDSVATQAHVDAEALQFETIDISAAAGSIQATGNVLAIHALNETAADDDFLLAANVSARGPVSISTQPRFFGNPTPKNLNDPSIGAPSVPVTIAPGDQVFSTAQLDVTITTTAQDAVIYYTLDGTIPTDQSSVYNGPLAVTISTQVRALAIQPDQLPGAVSSTSYIKLNPNLINFSSDLPIAILENFGGSSPNQSTMTNFVLVIIEPDEATGRATIVDDPDLFRRSGIKIRGNSSAGFPKKQYRVEIRDELDRDDSASVVGLPSAADWIFGAPYTDKTLFRNSLAFSLGDDIGLDAPRTQHVEVYLNQNGGNLDSGDYVGVYEIKEAIEIDNNGVDIAKLGPTDIAEPEITGGYLLRNEDVASTNPLVGYRGLELVNPLDYNTEQVAWITNHMNEFESVLFGAGFVDPATGYTQFVDVDSWINLMMVNELLRDQDAYVRSNYLYKDRGGKLVQGPMWDYNLTAGTGCCFDNRNPIGWQLDQNYNEVGHVGTDPGWIQRLLDDPDYAQLFIDRWFGLRDSEFSLTSLFARMDGFASTVEEAQARNFQTWNILGNANPGFPSPVTNTWEEQVDFVKTWLTTRVGWIDDQFQDRPEFDRPSGLVNVGDTVGFVAPAAGQIYYTVDGSDPRGDGGAINGILYNGTQIQLFDTTIVRARVFNSAVQPGATEMVHTQWSAPSIGSFLVTTPASAANLAITEVHYNPVDPTPAELIANPTANNDDYEFIELQNVGNVTIDLSSVSFVDGIEYTFSPQGAFVPTLAPGEFIVIAANHGLFENRYDNQVPVTGAYEGSLRNSGENIRLVDFAGVDIAQFSYADSGAWPGRADGKGSSLELVDHQLGYTSGNNWRPSAEYNGSPGAAGATEVDIIINEVLTHTDLPAVDTIEIHNTANDPINIGGWFLSDSCNNYR